MSKEPFIFLLIFGILVILAGADLWFSPDPRKTVYFSRVHGKMSGKEAQKTARQISIGLWIAGAVIVILCVIGLILSN